MREMWYMFDYGDEKDEIASAWKKAGNLIDQYRKPVFAINVTIIVLVVLVVIVVPLSNQEWITILSFIVGVLGFMLTGGLLYLQASNASKQMSAEQFKNAIEHLGNANQAVVLGGVHALHNLAVNFPKEYSQQVFEVLCSFIREETRKPKYQAIVMNMPVSSKNTQQVTSLIVIQTIVDKLFRYEKPEDSVYWDHKTKQYYQADLSGVFLPKVDLQDASLQGAVLRGANLQGADLYNAKLQGARIWNANLQGADLSYANLQDADLKKANLQEAKLIIADLQKAKLNNASLKGADLENADLQGALLHGADITDVKKADFTGAKGVKPGKNRKWQTLPDPRY